MIFKYIIINAAYAVLFSPAIGHKKIAEAKLGDVTGAGWVVFKHKDGKVYAETYGSSDSLGIISKIEDAEVIMNVVL